MKPPEILDTSRLCLRQPKAEDVAAIWIHYARDPQVTRYLAWRPHLNIGETEAFLARCSLAWSEGSAFPWTIWRKEDSRLMGMVELRIAGHKSDIGYVLARADWNKGYMSEAAGCVVDWAIKQEGIYRVWAICDVENLASARVLEKVGMEREGVLRRWLVHPNLSQEPRDCYCYAKVKSSS